MRIATMQLSDLTSGSDHPLAQTSATMMLAAGIERAARDTGATQRDLAKQLNYRTSVVLSHMASGRVPIPIDRAAKIARVLKLDASEFLLAVLEQRHPEVNFKSLLGVQMPSESALAAELETIAGVGLDRLPEETKHVLREVVASADPARRWVTPAELTTLATIRKNKVA
jgi:transcriptional regulator with XRE-family HTH domain